MFSMGTGQRSPALSRVVFFLPMEGCSQRCAYCNQHSITGHVDRLNVDAVKERIRSLRSKTEVCFFGGSFLRLDHDRLETMIDAFRSAPPGSRLRFSTHPEDLDDSFLRRISSIPLGAVELGIPSLDRQVLRSVGRLDQTRPILSLLEKLAREGIPVVVQLMQGLPGQSLAGNLNDLEQIARIKGPQVWGLRLYPCLVLEGTELAALWRQGRYTPSPLDQAVRDASELSIRAKTLGFDVVRVGLHDAPTLRQDCIAGPYHPAFGELVLAETTAKLLHKTRPQGPWTLWRRHLSTMTGHGRRGLCRLAEFSGLPENIVWDRLRLFP